MLCLYLNLKRTVSSPLSLQLPYGCYSATRVAPPNLLPRTYSLEGGPDSPYSSCTYQSIEGLLDMPRGAPQTGCCAQSSACHDYRVHKQPCYNKQLCNSQYSFVYPKDTRRGGIRSYVPDYYGGHSSPIQTPPYQTVLHDSELPKSPYESELQGPASLPFLNARNNNEVGCHSVTSETPKSPIDITENYHNLNTIKISSDFTKEVIYSPEKETGHSNSKRDYDQLSNDNSPKTSISSNPSSNGNDSECSNLPFDSNQTNLL